MSWDTPQTLDDLKRDFLSQLEKGSSPQILLETPEAHRQWLTAQVANELLRLLYFSSLTPGPSLHINEGQKVLDTVQDLRPSASPVFEGLKIDNLTGYLKAVSGIVGVDVGAGTSTNNYLYTFAYGDATPQIIAALPGAALVTNVILIINTEFNGVGASISVGTSGFEESLLKQEEVDPVHLGIYSTAPGILYGGATDINIYITPGGGASQGAGIVIVYTL